MTDAATHRLNATELDQVSGGFDRGRPGLPRPDRPTFPPPFPIPLPPRPSPLPAPFPRWPHPPLRIPTI